MYKSAARVVIGVLFSWLLVVAPAFADLSGDLSGTITDSTGATVSAARVTIQNLNTGQTRVITTSDSGEFSAPQLEIGNYRLTVEKDGFKSFSQNAVVRSGEKTRVDVQMQLGNISESVVVESGAIPTLDSTTTLSLTFPSCICTSTRVFSPLRTTAFCENDLNPSFSTVSR